MLLLPFFINRKCQDDDFSLFSFGDSFLSGKEFLIIVFGVILLFVFLIFIVMPILYCDKATTFRMAKIHSENKEFVKYVLESNVDNFLSPYERWNIYRLDRKLDNEESERNEQEYLNNIQQKLQESLKEK